MKSSVFAAISVVAVFISAAVYAHGGATGVVKERMDEMSVFGASMKTMKRHVTGEVAFDAAEVRKAAKAIADGGGAALTALFPKGSLMAPSEALPAVWTDWARFQELAEEMRSAAAALVGADALDAKAAAKGFRGIAGTCKACHRDFRMKKK